MTGFVRDNYEKLLLGAAVALLVTALVWDGTADGATGQRAADVVSRPPEIRSRMGARPELAEAGSDWDGPEPQSSGPSWIFEVFTPPEIFYDPNARAFRVAPPADRATVAAPDGKTAFGVELLAVWHEPFRLQLAGYVGGPDDRAGVFDDLESAETVLARAGQRLPQQGVWVEELTVKNHAPRDDFPGSFGAAAVALVKDEWTGAEVRLESRIRTLTDEPAAALRLGGARVEVEEGDTIIRGASEYRIERIEVDPPAVDLIRLAAGGLTGETRTIRPANLDVAAVPAGWAPRGPPQSAPPPGPRETFFERTEPP